MSARLKSDQELKSRIFKLIKEDEELRYAVTGLLGLDEILRRMDGHSEEMRKLREDMVSGFKRHDEMFALMQSLPLIS